MDKKDLLDWAQQHRDHWQNTGQTRPAFAISPGPGQESVWDYPRPPKLMPDPRHVQIHCGETLIANTRNAWRLMETASPPTFYLPPDDVQMEYLKPCGGGSVCEWKGQAAYFSIEAGDTLLQNVAWCYPEPFGEYAVIAGYLAFYPHNLHCTVNGERVIPQSGKFYGGWITSELTGPFKGEPGTAGW